MPAGKIAVYPTTIAAEAPSYQIAWAIDAYTQLDRRHDHRGHADLGVVPRATELATAATQGTAHLVAAFDWLETDARAVSLRHRRRLGLGRLAAPARSAAWSTTRSGTSARPRSRARRPTSTRPRTAGSATASASQCWEDFVLSEGTVSYLAARALDVVAPTVGAHGVGALRDAARRRSRAPIRCGRSRAARSTCIKDNLFTQRAVHARRVLLQARRRQGRCRASSTRRSPRSTRRTPARPATMQDMLDDDPGRSPATTRPRARRSGSSTAQATTPTPAPLPVARGSVSTRGAASRWAPITNTARATLSPSFSNTTRRSAATRSRTRGRRSG